MIFWDLQRRSPVDLGMYEVWKWKNEKSLTKISVRPEWDLSGTFFIFRPHTCLDRQVIAVESLKISSSIICDRLLSKMPENRKSLIEISVRLFQIYLLEISKRLLLLMPPWPKKYRIILRVTLRNEYVPYGIQMQYRVFRSGSGEKRWIPAGFRLRSVSFPETIWSKELCGIFRFRLWWLSGRIR